MIAAQSKEHEEDKHSLELKNTSFLDRVSKAIYW